MISKLLKIISEVNVEFNDKPSIQSGNYCYLIAGIELLFSVKDFVRLIYSDLFTEKNQTQEIRELKEAEKKYSQENISLACSRLRNYYETKDPLLYAGIQEIFYKSLYTTPVTHEQDDPNLVFLFFEKSFLFMLLFSRFQYITLGEQPEFPRKAPYSIYTLLNNINGLTINQMLSKVNVNGVFGAIAYHGAHYEVFALSKKNIKPMNTDFMGNLVWKTFTIICKSYNHKCDLRISEIIRN